MMNFKVICKVFGLAFVGAKTVVYFTVFEESVFRWITQFDIYFGLHA